LLVSQFQEAIISLFNPGIVTVIAFIGLAVLNGSFYGIIVGALIVIGGCMVLVAALTFYNKRYKQMVRQRINKRTTGMFTSFQFPAEEEENPSPTATKRSRLRTHPHPEGDNEVEDWSNDDDDNDNDDEILEDEEDKPVHPNRKPRSSKASNARRGKSRRHHRHSSDDEDISESADGEHTGGAAEIDIGVHSDADTNANEDHTGGVNATTRRSFQRSKHSNADTTTSGSSAHEQQQGHGHGHSSRYRHPHKKPAASVSHDGGVSVSVESSAEEFVTTVRLKDVQPRVLPKIPAAKAGSKRDADHKQHHMHTDSGEHVNQQVHHHRSPPLPANVTSGAGSPALVVHSPSKQADNKHSAAAHGDSAGNKHGQSQAQEQPQAHADAHAQRSHTKHRSANDYERRSKDDNDSNDNSRDDYEGGWSEGWSDESRTIEGDDDRSWSDSGLSRDEYYQNTEDDDDDDDNDDNSEEDEYEDVSEEKGRESRGGGGGSDSHHPSQGSPLSGYSMSDDTISLKSGRSNRT
jgi:hypothetical protein